ncbi:MAG: HlyD family efflux transporter periplasmic adaptor subunit [Planctomycetota bacterium]
MLTHDTTLANNFPVIQLVRTSRLIRRLGTITLIVLIGTIVALLFAPWRQTAYGTGVAMALDPQQRPQPVLAQAKGIIGEVPEGLGEGVFVEEGQLLMKLVPFAEDMINQQDQQIAAILAQEESAIANLENMKMVADAQRLSGESLNQSLQDDLEAQERDYNKKLNYVKEMVAAYDDAYFKYKVARESRGAGVVSEQDLNSALQKTNQAMSKVEQADDEVRSAFSKLESKRQEIASKQEEIRIKNQQADQKINEQRVKINDIENKLLALRQKRSEGDRLTVLAPRAGYIQGWTGVESYSVKPGDQLCMIVPEADQMAVEMKIRGLDMPLVHEGDRVRLQFEGWPAVQFAGWPSVAVGTFGGKVTRVFPTRDSKGMFRILVTPDNHFPREDGWPGDRYLKQGVQANGWVLLNEVPLGYEIWRQLNGFPQTVADEEPGKEKEKGKKLKPPKI